MSKIFLNNIEMQRFLDMFNQASEAEQNELECNLCLTLS